jgi:pilus assembly protein FimV
MATKLSLAQEFHAIGDSDGARALVEEVVAGSTGPLKAKAQRFLADLG